MYLTWPHRQLPAYIEGAFLSLNELRLTGESNAYRVVADVAIVSRRTGAKDAHMSLSTDMDVLYSVHVTVRARQTISSARVVIAPHLGHSAISSATAVRVSIDNENTATARRSWTRHPLRPAPRSGDVVLENPSRILQVVDRVDKMGTSASRFTFNVIDVN